MPAIPHFNRFALRAALYSCLAMLALTSRAADYPAPKEGSWIAKDCRFHTGQVMP